MSRQSCQPRVAILGRRLCYIVLASGLVVAGGCQYSGNRSGSSAGGASPFSFTRSRDRNVPAAPPGYNARGASSSDPFFPSIAEPAAVKQPSRPK